MMAVPANSNFNPDTMDMWVIYDRPTDYPDDVVARRWKVSAKGPAPTTDLIVFKTLADCREAFDKGGYSRLGRSAIDDEHIVETWL